MRWTLTLFIANLIALAWIFHMQRAEHSRAVEAHILRVEPADITGLQVSSLNNEDVTLEKRRNGWWITEPIQWRANPNAVQHIINQLLFIRREVTFKLDDILKSGKTLADYGLDTPLIRFQIQTARDELTVLLGAPTGLGNQKLYALEPDGKSIAVIDKTGFDGFDLAMSNLRSEAIFTLPLYAVESLVIKMNDPERTLRLTRKDNTWSFESPITTAADNERVSALLNTLSHLKVSDFVQPGIDANVPTELKNPQMRITLEGKNLRQTLLLNGELTTGEAEIRKRFGRMEDSPAIFTVISEPFEVIRERWEQLRDHRILKVDASKISAIDILQDGKKLKLQKLETGPWQIIDEGKDGELTTLPADTDAVLGLINHLNSLQAQSFVSDAPSEDDIKTYGLAPARGEVTLRGEQTRKILLGNTQEAQGIRYVSTSETQSVFGVQVGAIDLIEAASYAYRSRTLLTLPESASIKKITLQATDANSPTFTLEPQSDLFNALAPSFSPLNVKAFIPAEITQETVQPRGADRAIAWAYDLNIAVNLPGGDSAQEVIHSFRLTAIKPNLPLLGISSKGTQAFIFPDFIRNELLKNLQEN